jgi:hypothetical protein
MRKKLALFFALAFIVLFSSLVFGACTVELLPEDYTDEKCFSLKPVTVEVMVGGVTVQGAEVSFSLNDYTSGYRLINNAVLYTDALGRAENKVLFGNYGSVQMAYTATYTAFDQTQTCAGVTELSVGEKNLSGSIYEADSGLAVDATLFLTNMYNGRISYIDDVSGAYSANLPVCDYIVKAIPYSNSSQVLKIVANMSKDSDSVQDVKVSGEVCNGIDDDNDGSADEDFQDSNYDNFGPLNSPCKAPSGICSGVYVCSPNGYSTMCSSKGSLCEFCFDITGDDDNDDDAYSGQCSYSGICMLNRGNYFSPFYLNPFEKINCMLGCSPVSSDLNAVASARCN